MTVDVAAKLHAVFDAFLTPRTAPQYVPDSSPDGGRDGVLGDGPGSGPHRVGREKDTRTPGQQRADVFAAMIDSLARSGEVPTIGGAAPTALVTVPGEVLAARRGTGRVVGVADPVPFSAIDQILCDGTMQPVILDSNGAATGLGTTRRTFSRKQRETIIARDGPTCFECDVPATGAEAHHAVPWSQGGKTAVENGASSKYNR